MQRLLTELDLRALRERLESLKYQRDTSGVEMASLQGTHTLRFPEVEAEIVRLRGGVVRAVMVNRLQAGVEVPVHTDAGPRLERWHLPVATNPKAAWWDDENGEVRFTAGFWHGPVPYWLRHSVVNFGSVERIHLIVDLESTVLS